MLTRTAEALEKDAGPDLKAQEAARALVAQRHNRHAGVGRASGQRSDELDALPTPVRKLEAPPMTVQQAAEKQRSRRTGTEDRVPVAHAESPATREPERNQLRPRRATQRQP